jgi:hypothetical protein
MVTAKTRRLASESHSLDLLPHLPSRRRILQSLASLEILLLHTLVPVQMDRHADGCKSLIFEMQVKVVERMIDVVQTSLIV